jgi:undecaprenyl-diphosphatase
MASARTVTALAGATLAGALAAGVKVDATTGIDRAVRRRIHPRRSPALRSLGKGISYLAGPHTHPFVSAALGALIRVKYGKGGAAPIAASLAALALDSGVRAFVHQRRPPRAGHHRGRSRYGYPSGHVTAATAVTIAAASELGDELSPREQQILWAVVAAVSVAVGWSRLYLDEHWVDDVVGGWLAGVALGVGASALSTT